MKSRPGSVDKQGEPEYIAIGEVGGTQGRKGEVKVRPLTDYPERFHGLDRVRLHWPRADRSQVLVVEAVRFHKGRALVKFQGVDSITEAEALAGAVLQVPRSEVVDLPDERFFVFEIVGLTVYTEAGERLGVIKDVLQTGANDVYVVQRTGERDLLLPATREVVQEIDVDLQRVTVRVLPGLE